MVKHYFYYHGLFHCLLVLMYLHSTEQHHAHIETWGLCISVIFCRTIQRSSSHRALGCLCHADMYGAQFCMFFLTEVACTTACDLLCQFPLAKTKVNFGWQLPCFWASYISFPGWARIIYIGPFCLYNFCSQSLFPLIIHTFLVMCI